MMNELNTTTLGELLRATKAETGLGLSDLTVLSPQKTRSGSTPRPSTRRAGGSLISSTASTCTVSI
jgi:hypothetical protein